MSTRYGSYDEPERYQRREEDAERTADRRYVAAQAAAGEHVAEPSTMAAIRKSAATLHQRRSNLLSLHATADRYRDDPRRSGDYRRQLATITAREAELREMSTADSWAEYIRDRDGQREARTRRQSAAALVAAAERNAHGRPASVITFSGPRTQAEAEPAYRRCSGAGCSSRAHYQLASDKPLCGFHWDLQRAQAAADQPGREDQSQPAAACLSSEDKQLPVVSIQPPTAAIPAPTPAALNIECPQCHAAAGARCLNYSGSHCAPHGARNKAAKAADAPIPAPRPQPAPPKKATAAAIRTEADEDLEADMRALLARYTLGTVLDAAWDADRALRPRGARTA